MLKRRNRAQRGRSQDRSFRPRLEALEPRMVLSSSPIGALSTDTGEYMLGDVRVTLVLMESTGAASSEDWTAEEITAVKDKVRASLDWWEDLLAAQSNVHSVRFHIDTQFADNPVPTAVEPISRISNDYTIWVGDFLDHVEANSTSDLSTAMRLFNNEQRQESGDDWGFTIFVADDTVDADGMFAAGGSFRRAFAFAGGRFFIAPASRPTVSFTHEAGHMFWARDEYSGAGSYLDRRGYYNTQNLNAADNPAPGFEQSNSIMASGALMTNAFLSETSSTSSLEMIGWKDSDQDGVFDVLDVPLLLRGSGGMDPVTGKYRFVGETRVQALPNQNPSGLQSDITINRIDVVEYRIDDGSWQTIMTPGEPAVPLDVLLEVPGGDHQLELRSRSLDAGTGETVSTSGSFIASTIQRTVTQENGIAGFAYADLNENGNWDEGEPGVADSVVRVVDLADQPIDLWTVVEPDDFDDQAVLNEAVTGVELRALGGGLRSDSVYSRISSQSSTPSRVLANDSAAAAAIRTSWNSTSRRLRMDFDSPVSAVRIDAIGNGGTDYGRMEIYNDESALLGRYTSEALGWGESETMLLRRFQADIAYAIAGSHAESEVHLDHLRFGPGAEMVSDAGGAFWLPEVAAGDYRIQVVAPVGWETSSAANAVTQVTVSATAPTAAVGFGLSPPDWHNPYRKHDINNDGHRVPLDALLLINDLNSNGPRSLPSPSAGTQPPPYLDVNADGSVTSVDALQVITQLNDALDVATGTAALDVPLFALAVEAEGEPPLVRGFFSSPLRAMVESEVPVIAGAIIEKPGWRGLAQLDDETPRWRPAEQHVEQVEKTVWQDLGEGLDELLLDEFFTGIGVENGRDALPGGPERASEITRVS